VLRLRRALMRDAPCFLITCMLGGKPIKVFMNPPHLCRHVIKVGKKGHAKQVMAICMNTDKAVADAMHAKLERKIKDYLKKTSEGDQARYMASHQLLAGPMDGTYTSDSSEVFQRMCESIRAAPSITDGLSVSLILEKKCREEAVKRVQSSPVGERFPPRIHRLLQERRAAFDKHYSQPFDKYVQLPFVGCTSEGTVTSGTSQRTHKVVVWQPAHSRTPEVGNLEFW
jgi:hypothetical protein